jgi:hypothetical protein
MAEAGRRHAEERSFASAGSDFYERLVVGNEATRADAA